ncbi:E3 ubiquitin-protein ligase DTX1-like isoform X1, partial [Lates japonicus]
MNRSLVLRITGVEDGDLGLYYCIANVKGRLTVGSGTMLQDLSLGSSQLQFHHWANSNNMLLASAVVVWEWLNEHGRWRPYSPAVSHQIEAAIRSSDPRGGSVVLGQVDSRLSPYIIDLQSMHQFRQDTALSVVVRGGGSLPWASQQSYGLADTLSTVTTDST